MSCSKRWALLVSLQGKQSLQPCYQHVATQGKQSFLPPLCPAHVQLQIQETYILVFKRHVLDVNIFTKSCLGAHPFYRVHHHREVSACTPVTWHLPVLWFEYWQRAHVRFPGFRQSTSVSPVTSWWAMSDLETTSKMKNRKTGWKMDFYSYFFGLHKVRQKVQCHPSSVLICAATGFWKWLWSFGWNLGFKIISNSSIFSSG